MAAVMTTTRPMAKIGGAPTEKGVRRPRTVGRRGAMVWGAATFAALALTAAPSAASEPGAAAPTELVMIEETFCEWCQLWNEEIGVVYDKTEEGRRAPLRRVDIHGAAVDALKLKMRAHYTPTFVLMRNGTEIGRIEGYPGEDFFWGLLGQLLEQLPEDGAAASKGKE